MRLIAFVLSCTLALVITSVIAQNRTHGIVGQNAPSWAVTEWINLPNGTDSIDIKDFKGKVVYLYGFQSWCPGCHSRGFPTLQNLVKHYQLDDDVQFVAVQTTFEGYSTNTSDAAWRTAKRYDLNIPVGHSGSQGKWSTLMQKYRTGGTPWTVIIDKEGVVRFNNFHIQPAEAIKLIDRLKGKKESSDVTKVTSIETLPLSRGGQSRIGDTFPDLSFDRWIRSPSDTRVQTKGRAMLYRWWTDSCPFCEASLPAIEHLRKKYDSKGLQVVCVYHPKPPRSIRDKEILTAAKRIGYKGAIAVDLDWSELHKAYGGADDWPATSVSFLVDEDGAIRFVHPGPVLFPSDDPQHKQENDDFQLLEKAIQNLLTN